MRMQKIEKLDNIILKMLACVWSVVKRLDPKPLQAHFAAREPANAHSVGRVFNASLEDAGKSMVRVCNNLIKSENNPKGLFPRNSLVKVYNPANQHFAVLYVQGSGSHSIPRNGVSLDYEARLQLGITKEAKGDGNVDLLVGIANVGDREFFHMYTDHEKSSRSARVLGWGFFALGISWSAIEVAKLVIASGVALLGLL